MAALGYDSAMILADAMKRANSTDGQKVRDALAATKNFDGVTGNTTINEKRDADKPAVILQVKNGKFQIFGNRQSPEKCAGAHCPGARPSGRFKLRTNRGVAIGSRRVRSSLTPTIQPNVINEFIQQLVNGLALGSIYALIALGYTMVYGVLRFINFAHSDVLMLGAFAAYFLAPKVVAKVFPAGVVCRCASS